MDEKDRAKSVVRVFAALLKSQIKRVIGDETLGILSQEFADMGQENLEKFFDDWINDSAIQKQILDATEKADRCVRKMSEHWETQQYASQYPLRRLPTLVEVIEELPGEIDEARLKTTLHELISPRWEKLAEKQVDWAVEAYIRCIRRALLPVEGYTLIIIGRSVLRTEEKVDLLIQMVQTLIERSSEEYALPFLPTPIPLQLPPRAPYFTGREKELAELVEELAPGKVITLCGPGGIGKTVLSAEAVWQLTGGGTRAPEKFPDVVLFHSFYGKPDVDQALEYLARAYGEEARPTPQDAARRALAGRQALLILDGAEEADDLSRVLAVRGGCGVLVTSRSRGDALEMLCEIDPLECEGAAELLVAWSV